MKITVNQDEAVVKTVREGLNAQADTARADWSKPRIQNVCAKSSKSKLQILILRDFAIVCFIISQSERSL